MRTKVQTGHGEPAQSRGDFQIISRSFFSFCLGTCGLFVELGRAYMISGMGGPWECLHCGVSTESVEHVLIKNASHYSQRCGFFLECLD